MSRLVGVVAVTVVLITAGCASLSEIVERPTARVVAGEITALSFDRAEITFDVEVANPNPVRVRLAGIDYELFFEESSFLRGATEEELEIAANGTSTVRIPVGVGYAELIESVRSLSDRRETAYRLAAGVSVDVPALGRVRLPVERSGTIPVVRAPRVRVRELSLESLSLSGADLHLHLGVTNPNAFGLSLQTLDYALRINGELWGSALISEPAELSEGGEREITLPVTLDFGAMGRSVRELIVGRGNVAYNLTGTLKVGTTLEMLDTADLPLSLDGEIGITRGGS
ncbi:MAG: LEA type 2 family protein [Spirochaetia bacterium]